MCLDLSGPSDSLAGPLMSVAVVVEQPLRMEGSFMWRHTHTQLPHATY